jgi:hypothetical protein
MIGDALISGFDASWSCVDQLHAHLPYTCLKCEVPIISCMVGYRLRHL